MPTREALIGRWSAAIREVEVLEPWLTESHWDENYWDDVATIVVDRLGTSRRADEARGALVSALRAAFPTVRLESDNLFYRDRLDDRLDLIVTTALGPDRG